MTWCFRVMVVMGSRLWLQVGHSSTYSLLSSLSSFIDVRPTLLSKGSPCLLLLLFYSLWVFAPINILCISPRVGIYCSKNTRGSRGGLRKLVMRWGFATRLLTTWLTRRTPSRAVYINSCRYSLAQDGSPVVEDFMCGYLGKHSGVRRRMPLPV